VGGNDVDDEAEAEEGRRDAFPCPFVIIDGRFMWRISLVGLVIANWISCSA